MDERRLKKLEKGATVDGIAYGPCKITIDSRPKPAAAPVRNGTAAAVPETAPASRTATNAWLTVSLTEGKNREIRKLMASVGLEVARLIRLSYGPFQLGSLNPGEVREVPQKTLREQLGSLWLEADTAASPRSRNRTGTGGTTSCA